LPSTRPRAAAASPRRGISSGSGSRKFSYVSAEHGDNIIELGEAIVKRLDFSAVEEGEEGEEEDCIRVAIARKPNTGKSTLANRLTAPRPRSSPRSAGTTRDVVEGESPGREGIFASSTPPGSGGSRASKRISSTIR
jgi:predicted GTPase